MTVDLLERTYEEPPLVEAVFELFTGPPTVAFDQAEFLAGLPDYASEPLPWNNAVFNVELREGEMVSTSLQQSSGERRWNKDRSRAVLAGPGVFAYNALPPYGHFSEHRPVLASLLGAYLDASKPADLQWLGHRYINRIHTTDSPNHFLAIYPKLPETLTAKHPPFSIQVEAAQFSDGVVVVSLSLAAHNDGLATYVLDLYARSTGDLKNWNVGAMIEWHDRAHLAVTGAFEMAITEAARASFREKK